MICDENWNLQRSGNEGYGMKRDYGKNWEGSTKELSWVKMSYSVMVYWIGNEMYMRSGC